MKRVENVADNLDDEPMTTEQERLMHQLIRDMTERVADMRFNTAISAMMEYINAFSGTMPRRAYEILIQVLNPFAPHMTSEIWEKLGHDGASLVFEPWPTYDESKLVKSSMTIAVSVNGKLRGTIDVPANSEQPEIVDAAKLVAEKYLVGEIVKTIYVPNKMVNFVIK